MIIGVRDFKVGDRFDIDMYEGVLILEDKGDQFLVQSRRGHKKTVYKELLDDFASLCNEYGLSEKGMTKHMPHLTKRERQLCYYLRNDGWYVKKVKNDYILFTDEDQEMYKTPKRLVHKLQMQGYVRERGNSLLVLNPHKFGV